MSQVHTLEEIHHLPEVNNGMSSQDEVQANINTVDLTPLVHEYLTTARALRAWRFLRRTSNLES